MGFGGWKSLMPAPIKFLTTGDMGSWFGIPGLDEDANSKLPGVGRFFKSDDQKKMQDQLAAAADQYAQMRYDIPEARIAGARGAASAYDPSSSFLGEMSGGRYQPNLDRMFVNSFPDPKAAKEGGAPPANKPPSGKPGKSGLSGDIGRHAGNGNYSKYLWKERG